MRIFDFSMNSTRYLRRNPERKQRLKFCCASNIYDNKQRTCLGRCRCFFSVLHCENFRNREEKRELTASYTKIIQFSISCFSQTECFCFSTRLQNRHTQKQNAIEKQVQPTSRRRIVAICILANIEIIKCVPFHVNNLIKPNALPCPRNPKIVFRRM